MLFHDGVRMPFGFRRRHKHNCPKQTVHGCTCPPEVRATGTTLDRVEVGSNVEVCCVTGIPRIARRLMEMGFTPGTPIKVLRCAPLADPVEYELRGYLVSLRRDEAALIRVLYTSDKFHYEDSAQLAKAV